MQIFVCLLSNCCGQRPTPNHHVYTLHRHHSSVHAPLRRTEAGVVVLAWTLRGVISPPQRRLTPSGMCVNMVRACVSVKERAIYANFTLSSFDMASLCCCSAVCMASRAVLASARLLFSSYIRKLKTYQHPIQLDDSNFLERVIDWGFR